MGEGVDVGWVGGDGGGLYQQSYPHCHPHCHHHPTTSTPSATLACDTNTLLITLPLCPSSVLRHAPSLSDHSLTVRSPLEVATTRSMGEKHTPHTPRLWPLKGGEGEWGRGRESDG